MAARLFLFSIALVAGSVSGLFLLELAFPALSTTPNLPALIASPNLRFAWCAIVSCMTALLAYLFFRSLLKLAVARMDRRQHPRMFTPEPRPQAGASRTRSGARL
ncbi:MAG TPA: hypothetical protein VMN36_10975 [Verrucomicrobiales bacterium]|nr:hypothetical protein [Verrucomicrobiales bacterium]